MRETLATMKRRAPRTLLELAISRQGIVKGSQTMTFIVSWGMADQAHGGPITLEEYAAHWKVSRATAFREQARFREAFPEHATPQAIVDRLRATQRAMDSEVDVSYAPLSVVAA